MHVTTSEAAHIAGVQVATLHQWRRRGYLTPVTRDTWDERDVWRCVRERMPRQRHAELDMLWSQVNCQ